MISEHSSKQLSNKFKPCSLEELAKKEEDLYDLYDNSYVIDREPVLYAAKKDEQVFSSKVLCPKMLLSRCFSSERTNQSQTVTSHDNSCLYNRIFESDNLKLKQQNQEKNSVSQEEADIVELKSAFPAKKGEPVVKAAASILVESNAASLSDIVHKKEKPSFFSKTNSILAEKNFKFIFIGLALVFLVSITSLSLTVYLLIKRRNNIVYQPANTYYPQDER